MAVVYFGASILREGRDSRLHHFLFCIRVFFLLGLISPYFFELRFGLVKLRCLGRGVIPGDELDYFRFTFTVNLLTSIPCTWTGTFGTWCL